LGYLKIIYSKERKPYTSYPEQLCNFIAKSYFKKEYNTLLDVGCGRGDHLTEFQRMGFQCKGIDKTEEAKELAKNIEIGNVDVEKEPLPFKDNSFDVVFNKSLLEHLNYPDNFMRETYRVLKPGGRLIILTPDWESNYKMFYGDYTHKTPFTIDSLGDINSIFGFNIIEVKKFRQLPVLWKYPALIFFSKVLYYLPKSNIKYIKYSKEIMLLSVGEKVY
jgi:SAM-dependent methyltransferase